MTDDANYWIVEAPHMEDVNVESTHRWVGLVSEPSGGIVAYGRRDIIEACAEALNSKPDDWEGA